MTYTITTEDAKHQSASSPKRRYHGHAGNPTFGETINTMKFN